ncbi:MAG: amidohydrolase family protein [Planctomycetota bacterium]
MENETLIDVWAQPATKGGFSSVPEIARLFKQSGASAILDSGIPPEMMIAAMDQAGVSKVLLTAWHRPGGWVFSNDEVAAIAKQFPGRVYGAACVNLEKPVEAVKELERAVKELGFIALRIIPWLWNRPPNDKLYYPLYVKCIELDIPFCTQVGHTGPLAPSETGRPIPYIDEIALTFPELKIVGGHIGYPWTDEMIALAWKHANVYIDTSAYLPRYYPPSLLHFMNTYGKDKVLFATNFPMLTFDRCAADARKMTLSDEVRKKFFHENARRVFRFDKGT